MAKIKYHSRKFLNKAKGTAAIEVAVETYEWNAGVMDASISITDCSRRVTLDFSVYNKKDLDEKINKLGLLITEFTNLQELFFENYDGVVTAMEEAIKKRKHTLKKKKEVVPVEL